MSHSLTLSPLLLAGLSAGVFALVGGATSADAQPGATPPGSVPPSPGFGPGGPGYGGGYPPPPPPMGPPPPAANMRQGFHMGAALGLGAMNDNGGRVECFNCDQTPPAPSLSLHVGGMINPRLSLQGEIASHMQVVDADNSVTLNQGSFLLAAQFWVTPRLWLKGGLGISSLSFVRDGFEDEVDQGGTFMAAIGYEIVQGRQFALDLLLRTYVTGYSEIEQTIETPSIGLGINWY